MNTHAPPHDSLTHGQESEQCRKLEKGVCGTGIKGKAMSRKRELKPASNDPKGILNGKLDEALEESFPASDPVSLGHSEHVGQPKPRRKTGGEWPKDAVGSRGKR